MVMKADVVLVLGSGPNAASARAWPKDWFDRIVVINNAWRVRPDWDDLVFPEDFPPDRHPSRIAPGQRLIEADSFVPAQNRYGGFVFAGGTMAFTAAYWALDALRPRIMAFMGCDMVYAPKGNTHFYGKGAADPLRPDVTLRDLGAKSARLGVMAADQGCQCVNLSTDPSELVFPRAEADGSLRSLRAARCDRDAIKALKARETALGYETPTGRYRESGISYDGSALAELDRDWAAVYERMQPQRR